MIRDRKHGVVYTPEWLAEQTVDWAMPEKPMKMSICDPACGNGIFLEAVLRRTMQWTNTDEDKDKAQTTAETLKGYDTDNHAANKARAILEEMGGKKENVHTKCWFSQMRECGQRYDLIIGNPPYIRWQNMHEEERTAVREAGVHMHGSSDLYLAFMETALQALKPGGRLALVTPGSWLWSKAAQSLRQKIHKEHTLEKVIDFEGVNVFEDVRAYVVLNVITKGERQTTPTEVHIGRGQRRAGGTRKGWIQTKNTRWRALDEATRKILEQDEEQGVPLGTVADIRIGVQTLADDVYVFEAMGQSANGRTLCATLKKPRKHVEIESEILRPIIKAGKRNDTMKRAIIYPYTQDGTPISEHTLEYMFPKAHAWLSMHRTQLEARSKAPENGWYGYARASTARGMFDPQAVVARMNRKPWFRIIDDDTTGYYGGYGVRPHDRNKLERITEQLNSTRMERYIAATSRQFGNGWYDYSKQFIEGFPIHGPFK